MLDTRPRLIALGTANPPGRYPQEELLQRFRVDDPRIRSLFTSSHIRTRHLYLPEAGPDGTPEETQGQLLKKHRNGAIEIGGAAIRACLEKAQLQPENIDFICCLTSTGWLTPDSRRSSSKVWDYVRNAPAWTWWGWAVMRG